MNNNWDVLIKAIVVMGIMAIWAITSLFNRESARPPAQRPTGPFPPTPGPRPGDPTMRWSPMAAPPPAPGPRRVAIGDDDILIISSENARAPRPGQARPISVAGPRRSGRLKPTPAKPARAVEPPPPQRAKLAGVSQNVNQQLAKTSLGMTPMDTMPATAGLSSLGLSTTPTAPVHAPTVTISAVAAAIADPVRLREAFIINEILQPPLALRGARGARR